MTSNELSKIIDDSYDNQNIDASARIIFCKGFISGYLQALIEAKKVLEKKVNHDK